MTITDLAHDWVNKSILYYSILTLVGNGTYSVFHESVLVTIMFNDNFTQWQIVSGSSNMEESHP